MSSPREWSQHAVDWTRGVVMQVAGIRTRRREHRKVEERAEEDGGWGDGDAWIVKEEIQLRVRLTGPA